MAGRVSRHLWEEREGGSSCLVVLVDLEYLRSCCLETKGRAMGPSGAITWAVARQCIRREEVARIQVLISHVTK